MVTKGDQYDVREAGEVRNLGKPVDLARRYGLNIRSVHWEPGELPGSEEWTELRALLREHPAQWMIWEGEPMGETAAGLEKFGVKSLVFDPVATAPPGGDFAGAMERNISELERAWK